MEIFIPTQLTDEIFAAMQHLIPQLSVSPPPTPQELQEIIGSASTILFLARHPEIDNQIAGASAARGSGKRSHGQRLNTPVRLEHPGLT